MRIYHQLSLLFVLFGIGIVTVYSHSIAECENKITHSDSRPIKTNTTKITYSHHTNSGMAIYTSVTIYPDHLVWSYNEARNSCHLLDSCQYDKEEFEELIKELSEIQFSAVDNHDHRLGGAGYGYSFEANSDRYFFFNNTFKFSGDYQKVSSTIQHFIHTHKTTCETIFEKYSKMPHQRANFGVFKTLPQELLKYAGK